MPKRLAAALGVLLVCATLSAGLWPFHAPRNHVSWLAHENGLAFARYGTALSTGPLPAGASEGPCTLEIWLAPAEEWKSGTFLALYDHATSQQLTFRQNYVDLVVQRRIGTRGNDATDLVLGEVFRRPNFFLTLTSDGRSTVVYVDGHLVLKAADFAISASEFSRTVILASSALQPDSWEGDIRGLAMYGSQLSAEDVALHYQQWNSAATPAITPSQAVLAYYPFDERQGAVVHNRAGTAPDLRIPRRYTVVDQLFLEPPWQEFRTQSNYVKDMLVNIAGFVPLGFWLELYFVCYYADRRRALLITLIGTAVSLTIEVVQSQLPTRFSGTTDLFTNTLGTALGVVCYRMLAWLWSRTVARRWSSAA